MNKKNKKFRKFTLTEISYHWVYALTFLPLLISGMFIGFQKAIEIEFIATNALITFHKYNAIAFILLPFLTALAGDWRIHLMNLTEAMVWKKNDILWMVKMAVFSKNLPPMGKFNPGQKVNLLLSLFGYFGFSVSGLIIWWKTGALGAWYFHIILCVLVIPMLVVHLFMATINPDTRKALPSIFGRKISLDYIKEHHALMLEPLMLKQKQTPSLKNIWGIFFFLPAATLIGWTFFTLMQYEDVEKQVRNFKNIEKKLIMPGKLISKHKMFSGNKHRRVKDCYSCHTTSGRISDQKCLKCHQKIAQRIHFNKGYHARFSKDCSSCHKDHQGEEFDSVPLKEKEFNHNLALFFLRGKHRELKCQKCHQQRPKRKFIGVAFQKCSDCHKNSHQGQLSLTCTKCHNQHGWKGKNLLFEHTQAKFQLKDSHKDLSCKKCHKKVRIKNNTFVRYKTKQKNCNDCHKNIHREEVGNKCSKCHTEKSWHNIVNFRHNFDSKFLLKKRHKNVTCRKCHRRKQNGKEILRLAKFKFASCNSCHQDPHQGQMKSKCNKCHSENGWAGRDLIFNHNKQSRYKLTARHTRVPCQKCHTHKNKIVKYTKIKFNKCSDCHQDVHKGKLRQRKCSACHSTKGWKGEFLKFDHQKTRFPLGKDHFFLKCASCHKQKNQYAIKNISCTTCHKKYKQILAGTYLTKSVQDDHYKIVSCQKCHQDKKQRSTKHPEQMCIKCHSSHYGELYLNRKTYIGTVIVKGKKDHQEQLEKALQIGSHNFSLLKKLFQK